MVTEYKDWSPTQVDSCGLNLEDRQDWLVAPVILTRDSECLEQSNFHTAKEMLKEVEHEEHEFGHWACGWLRIILVSPEHLELVEDMEECVRDHICLNSEHYSDLLAEERWHNFEVNTVPIFCNFFDVDVTDEIIGALYVFCEKNDLLREDGFLENEDQQEILDDPELVDIFEGKKHGRMDME